MRSFLLFLLPLTTVAFAIPLETTGYHLNPRAECPPFNRVQIDGGPSERVTLITEDIFSSSFRPSFWNGPKKGCRYETIQRKTVDDKTIRIDIIQPYKGGSFTAKQMDDIKKNYWVLSTFKDGGSTWVKILSGKWKPWAELELARELAQSSSIEDCKRGYAPIVRAVSNYRSENTEKRPSPLFNRYLFFETDKKDETDKTDVVKANWQDKTRWGRYNSREEYLEAFDNEVNQLVQSICSRFGKVHEG